MCPAIGHPTQQRFETLYICDWTSYFKKYIYEKRSQLLSISLLHQAGAYRAIGKNPSAAPLSAQEWYRPC